MRKTLTAITLFFAFALLTPVKAQDFSGLDKSPMDAAAYPSSHRVSDKLVKIIYSRPQLKGRSLAKLAPNGKVWRTGANEAVEITFYKDATIGGKAVKAGTYSLFTIPGDNEWTIIINQNLNQWGAYSYDDSADVVRVKGKVTKADKKLEAFSITFSGEGNNANLHMGWDTTRVTVPIIF